MAASEYAEGSRRGSVLERTEGPAPTGGRRPVDTKRECVVAHAAGVLAAALLVAPSLACGACPPSRAPAGTTCAVTDVAAEIAFLHANGGVRNPEILAANTQCIARACRTHGGVPCWLAGEQREHGVGVEESRGTAKQYYALACRDGVVDACVALAEAEGDIQRLTQLCDDSSPSACSSLVAVTATAWETDPRERHQLRVRACFYGDAGACEFLGLLELEPPGIPERLAVAEPYLALACQHGAWRSCQRLEAIFRDRGACATAGFFHDRYCEITQVCHPDEFSGDGDDDRAAD